MDIFVLKALVDDLQRDLAGAVVSKVFQMSPTDLLLRLWRQRDQRLWLSVHPRLARLHLTTSRFENPQRPPRFAAYLRAHLQPARLQMITVRPYDRIVCLTWERRDAAPVTLVHELMGTQANLILIDTADIVLDALRHVVGDATHRRAIVPGQPYQPPLPPPQRRLLPSLTAADLEALCQQGTFDASHLQRLIVGLSPLLSAELCYRSQGDPHRCWTLLQALQHRYAQGTLELSLCTMPDGTRQVSALPLTHAVSHIVPCERAQDAVAAVYEPAMQTTIVTSTRRDMQKRLRQRQQKLQKKICNLQGDERKLEAYLAYQRYGTLLVGHQAPRGTTQTQVVDYYSPEQAVITIPLDPRLSVQDNAQAYFKKYRKAKNGLDKVRAHLQQCAAEAHYLDGLAQQIAQAEDWPTLQLMQPELAGPRQERQPQRPQMRPKPAAAVPYRTFITPDGTTLYCGKSNQGNDLLLQQLAKPEDLWFHAHRHAGAHVLLQVRPQRQVLPQTLTAAASLAAFYSKGKDATTVEVIYTQARHVRKFRGARPGQVQVTTYRILDVAPRLPETA